MGQWVRVKGIMLRSELVSVRTKSGFWLELLLGSRVRTNVKISVGLTHW